MLRLAMLSHSAVKSGAELAMLDAAAALQQLDVCVAAIFLDDGPIVEIARQRGVQTFVVPTNPRLLDIRRHSDPLAGFGTVRSVGSAARVLGKLLKQLEIDLLETNSLKA